MKDSKKAILEELVGKQPHEAFEKYVNAELKDIIVTETNRYIAQKNTNSLFTATNLETFNAVLILTEYEQKCFVKKRKTLAYQLFMNQYPESSLKTSNRTLISLTKIS